MTETISLSPLMKSFLAGSFSGTCSTILLQPLDLVKTRLQSTIYNNSSSENGMVNIIRRVVQNDQIFGLWKGVTPSMIRCVPGVGMYFSSLHFLKSNFCDGEPGPLTAVGLGMMARTLTGVTFIPVTVVKTRYESGVFSYTGVVDAMRMIYVKEGPRGLTCGLVATILRDAPFSGLYLMFYTQTKKHIPKGISDSVSVPLTNFSCGIVSGLLASIVTQPADVLKTKMQLYPDKFTSVYQAALYVKKKYGMKGFMKGLAPRMIRRTLMAALAWTVYEQAMKVLGIK